MGAVKNWEAPTSQLLHNSQEPFKRFFQTRKS
ncbi:MAG: hypothetical protein MRERC_8c013 [Mycoplasmataceae bacterium RC_NB112A]|nr:MAG: hypothetical protein MRERC_8c013 [Mycoplasmataceae bacterium RC_NB112A]